MPDLHLEEPAKHHEKQALEFRQEFIDFGEIRIYGSWGLPRYENYDEWLEAIETLKSAETSPLKVPATTYFAICQNLGKIIGVSQLRHDLTEELRKTGGHVGYSTRPSHRGKGYGTAMVALVLEKAREMGLQEIMITCEKGNRASAGVAMKNGGVLTGETIDESDGETVEIYWINNNITTVDKIKTCEIEYSKYFSKAEETADFIRFTDKALPDMYSHNYTLIRGGNVTAIIAEEMRQKRDFYKFDCHVDVGKTAEDAEVSILGYYVYDPSKPFNAKACDVRKIDSPEALEDNLFIAIENDAEILGVDFCKRRNARRGKVYLAEGGVNSYICYDEGETIGVCDLFIHKNTAKIEDFQVSERHQRKGYGSAILKNMIDTATKAGATTIYLVTDEDDTAKEMYTKLGFSKVYQHTEILYRK